MSNKNNESNLSCCHDTNIASIIDHTILKADATKNEIENICKEAIQYGFASVCVNSSNISFVAKKLKDSSVKPIAVVGFPLGAASSASKAFETKDAISLGAEEIDMVINIGALKSKEYIKVLEDIKQVVVAARPYVVKVILETSYLTTEEKITASVLAKAAGAHFVKTSTGFGGGGATIEDIDLMRKTIGSEMKIKASGGIRTREDAEKMIQAGADRIGASASVAIVTNAKQKVAGQY